MWAFVVGFGLVPACVVIDPKAQLCAVGGEGCACTQGGACDFGLECREGSCIDPSAPVTGTEGETSNGETDDGVLDTGDDSTGDEARPNYIFVTSTMHTAGALGGLDGADAICQARADAAGLPGVYRAWLSTPDTLARDRFAGASGWVRPDGKPFARTVEQIVDGTFYYPPRLDEHGTEVPLRTPVWTGTDPTGVGFDFGGGMCDGWTSMDPEAAALQGNVGAGPTWWTDSYLGWCDTSAPLYCMGTDRDHDIEVQPLEGRRAFATEGGFSADGGLSGADALCQSEADAAGLSGSFLALLATSDMAAAARFDLAGEPWVRIDGIPLFPPGETMGSLPDVPVVFTANGSSAGSMMAWAGTNSVIAPSDETCDDWTSLTGFTNLGAIYHSSWHGWVLDGETEECSVDFRLLCFEE